MTVFTAAGIRGKKNADNSLDFEAVPALIVADSPEQAFEIFFEVFYASEEAKEGWQIMGTVKLRPIKYKTLKRFLEHADIDDEPEPKVHLHVVK